jgi:hypothetical protein
MIIVFRVVSCRVLLATREKPRRSADRAIRTSSWVRISVSSSLDVYRKQEPFKSLSFGPSGARMYSEYALSIVERQQVAEIRFVRVGAKGGRYGRLPTRQVFLKELGVDDIPVDHLRPFHSCGAPFFRLPSWNTRDTHIRLTAASHSMTTRVGQAGPT